MAKKFFTEQSLKTFVDDIKTYVSNAVSNKANKTHTHSISDITNLQSTLDGKLTLSGGTLTGNLNATKIIQNGRMFNNLATFNNNDTVNEIVIKTKIPFISGDSMPAINLKGYAYGVSSPIELTISFYIYNNAFCNMGVTSVCPWNPDVYLSTYTENNTKYVAISLVKEIYYARFVVNMVDIWRSEHDYSKNWEIVSKSKTNSTSVIPTTDKVTVPYKPLATDISGNASTATNATKASTADVANSVAWGNVTNKTNATQSNSGLMSNTDKTKLDGIASGANKTIVDSSMSSSSTNPVQNKIVNSAINTALTNAKAYTDTLETKVNTKANASDLISHTGNKSNPHGVTLAQLGLTANSAELNYVDGVTSNIQTQLNGKSNSNHTHNYAGSSSAGGSANSAVKLATARTIGLGTGATGTATSFDGSGNITIPVTDVKEAYLSWGGKNFASSFGCIDAAMISDLGANRLAFAKPAGVTIEYSRDSGATWTDYGTSNANKSAFFTSIGNAHLIGKADSTNKATAAYQLRVTVNATSSNIYTVLNKFCIYVSTNGSSGTTCTIQIAKTSAPTTYTTMVDNQTIGGWSGYNIINTSGFTFGSNSDQYNNLRFIFKCTGGSTEYNGLQVMSIQGFGGVGWTTPSTMAKTGHLYTYDGNQNATFPAAISAPNINGTTVNGTTYSGSGVATVAEIESYLGI